MPDPMVLNDLAGIAILEGRHREAAKLLSAAAELVESVSAKRVLVERAQEEARIDWLERLQFEVRINWSERFNG